MITSRDTTTKSSLLSLEATVTAARSGFACMFSNSDEYESALIRERRAEGRYGQPHRNWPVALFIGCTLLLGGAVLMMT
jgi:hypothetical protein